MIAIRISRLSRGIVTRRDNKRTTRHHPCDIYFKNVIYGRQTLFISSVKYCFSYKRDVEVELRIAFVFREGDGNRSDHVAT